MSGIEEGRLDKPKDEACLLLYFAKIKVAFKAVNIYTNNIYMCMEVIKCKQQSYFKMGVLKQ